jgi:tetratricopeptide (TPR) repeat protein
MLLNKEFRMSGEEIDIILSYRGVNEKFHSVSELYFVKGLSLESLSKLLLPHVKVESQNELEDSEIPLSISLVEAMERRSDNVLEELREKYMEDAQEHQYALAESYHYVGLALYDVGDDEGAKIYYEKAIKHFDTVIQRFKGLALVNAQYRIGELYEELALLFEEEQASYYSKAIDAFTRIIDEQKSIRLFGSIRGLASIRIENAKDKVEYIKRELH